MLQPRWELSLSYSLTTNRVENPAEIESCKVNLFTIFEHRSHIFHGLTCVFLYSIRCERPKTVATAPPPMIAVFFRALLNAIGPAEESKVQWADRAGTTGGYKAAVRQVIMWRRHASWREGGGEGWRGGVKCAKKPREESSREDAEECVFIPPVVQDECKLLQTVTMTWHHVNTLHILVYSSSFVLFGSETMSNTKRKEERSFLYLKAGTDKYFTFCLEKWLQTFTFTQSSLD